MWVVRRRKKSQNIQNWIGELFYSLLMQTTNTQMPEEPNQIERIFAQREIIYYIWLVFQKLQ
jgi:hypothetical protein